MSLLAIVAWMSYWSSYEDCLRNDEISSTDCFTGYIMLAPPIQEAQDLADACNETDLERLAKIGKIAVTEKLSEYG